MKKLTFAFIFVAVAFTAPAQAETMNCTPITALPAVITVQGIYCFTADLATAMTSGNAIDIQTSNVVLDLNGFKLGGLGAGLGMLANGIVASDRQNITIKNGTIRGFRQAIFLSHFSGASQGHIVEDIRADQNTLVGIAVMGDGTIVRNNQVVATGGSTAIGNGYADGIIVDGKGSRVLNNDVINTAQGTGVARGIHFYYVTGGLAVNNRITVADVGIEYQTPPSTGKYRDNLTFGVTTPFTGGTAVGTND
jgi:hypothetical protein